MLNSKLSRSALSLILAVMLVFSIFTLGVYAETEAETVVEVETDTVADGSDTATGDTATDDGQETEAETEEETDAVTEEKEDEPFLSTFDIVTIIIFAVLVIVLLVYCLKNREKVGKFLRSLRSEFKKISWSSWRDVRKNTLVVLVVVISIALIIAGLDLLFNQGISALKNLLS